MENPRALKAGEEKIKKLQKELARREKGSARRERTKVELARAHEKVRNVRMDALHKATTRTVRRNRVIGGETLRVGGMTRSARGTVEEPGSNVAQKAGLNRSILDASFGRAAEMFRYKARWHEREFIQVDPWFPSSKLCCACGEKHTGLTLAERKWTCSKCGTTHDRDVNAAVNLEVEAIQTPAGSSAPRTTRRCRGRRCGSCASRS